MLHFISCLLVLSGMAAGFTKEYTFFSKLLSWNDAQTFCKLNYTGLAVITDDVESQRLMNAENKQPPGWIGMNRSWIETSSSSVWLWNDGHVSSFFHWKQGEPNNLFGNENCVHLTPYGWNDAYCGTLLPFYCYKTLVLVTETKTWEDAHDYCRMKHTDLVSLVSKSQIQLAEMESNQTQTGSVWTGLRFLGGKWLWVSKEPLGELVSLPSCPARPYRCGARNTKTQVWENRNCNDKLKFMCYD